MDGWQNWSYGKNRMRSVLEEINAPPKEPKKWYHYICGCFKQNPIIEDDSDSYREYTDGDNN
jgi:hypothetical protein